MSSLSATQSDGYYLPPEYFESGKYKKVSRNKFASEISNNGKKLSKVGHNQWLKHGVVRFELPEKASSKHCVFLLCVYNNYPFSHSVAAAAAAAVAARPFH